MRYGDQTRELERANKKEQRKAMTDQQTDRQADELKRNALSLQRQGHAVAARALDGAADTIESLERENTALREALAVIRQWSDEALIKNSRTHALQAALAEIRGRAALPPETPK